MDIQKEFWFWMEALNIPQEQFNKPYIKKTSSERINHKGGFGHGTCTVRIGGAQLAEKMHMSIKAISDKYYKRACSSVGKSASLIKTRFGGSSPPTRTTQS